VARQAYGVLRAVPNVPPVQTVQTMQPVLTSFAAVFGLFVGSFLNVVIYRVPKGESVVRPRSRCTGCGTQLAEYDNIPVVSWLLLRGKCRTCKRPISVRYPVVEAATAAAFGLMAWHFGWSWELPAFLYLAAVGIALAAIDIDTQRLPDAIVKPSYAVAAVLLGGAAALERDWHTLGRVAAGGAVLGAFYLLLVFIYPRGMGWGDVKLAGVLGMYLGWLGWGSLVVGGFLGFLLGGLIGAGLMVAGRAGRKTKIPYGPYMIAGTFLAIFWGQRIADWYSGILGH
jgi:leader peptidase (prepilin peptidase) / N-methyltransferase